MKFLYCFDIKLKEKLIANGYKLLSESNGLFIFENKTSNKTFNFEEFNKNQFTFSDNMIF